MIKGILFDKDGTLLEFSNFWIDSTIEFIKSFNIKKEESKNLLDSLGVREDKVLENSLLASATIKDIAIHIANFLCEDRTYINKSLDDFYYQALVENKNNIKATCDLENLFTSLKDKGIKIGLVTSDNYRQAEYSFRQLGMDSYIDFYASGDRYKKKPEKECLYAFMEKFKLNPSEIAVCGDSKIDMELGFKDSLKVAVLSGTGSCQMLTDYADIIVKKPEKILKIL